MEKVGFDLSTFIEHCKILLPKYLSTLNRNIDSKTEIPSAKKVVLIFLKEYLKHNNTKFYRSRFNVNFVNKFVREILPGEYPELLAIDNFTIQSIIINFIDYLSLKDILDRKIQKEIIEQFNNLTERKKELKTSLKDKQITEIKNNILEYSLRLNGIYNDEHQLNQIFNYFESKRDDLIIRAILEVCRTAEDAKFLKILYFIDEFLRIDTLPSQLIEYLKQYSKADAFSFRLLMLYNTCFLGGYILKKSLGELMEELNIDQNSFYKYLASLFKNSDDETLSNFTDFYTSQSKGEVLLDIEPYINEIIPIDETLPYANIENGTLFKLPKRIKLELSDHIEFLKSVSESFREKIRFISSDWDKYNDCFSTNKEENLFKNSENLYYKGEYHKALTVINKLLKVNPESAAALYLKGKILGQQGAHFNALKIHLKSLIYDPYRIETYMDISYLLEIGGYFHASIVITSLLLRFCPFDFNLYMQLAISTYQLSLSFKPFLRAAGLINNARLINFLLRYWVHDRIKPRDSLKDLGLEVNYFNEILTHSQLICKNMLKVMELYGDNVDDEDSLNSLSELIRNSLNFFPNKEDHNLKNWFIYELTVRLLRNFNSIYYENNYNLPYLIASEDFINLCFEISKVSANQILDTWKKSKNQMSLEIDTEIILEDKELVENSFYNLARFFISLEGFSEILLQTGINLIMECTECPNNCLSKPHKWCPAFYMFRITDKSLDHHSNLILFIDTLNTDFELSLEDRGLKNGTINKKVENVEYFLDFLIKKDEIEDHDDISENFQNYLNEENLLIFLGNYVLQHKIISTPAAMKYLCQSLKSFFQFLKREYGYFKGEEYSNLNKVLNSVDYFIQNLEDFKKSPNVKEQVKE